LSPRFARARALALDITPLRESVPYRALWLGQLVSQFGSNMRVVAVAYQIFQITHSTVAVGFVGVVQLVPLLVFGLIGGGMADRRDRRRLSAQAQAGLMASSGGLVVITLAGHPSVVGIYVLLAVSSAFAAIDSPARSAMVPALVPPGTLPAAMALRQVVFQVTQIVGPALGGVLIATLPVHGGGSPGVALIYGIDAATYIAGLVSLKWVPTMMPQIEGEPQANLESVREGLSFAIRRPVILSIFLVDLVAMIFGMPRAVFPALAERTFQGGAGILGLLYAAPAAGALISALTTGWVTRIRKQGVAVILSVIAWGTAITLAGLTLFSLALTVLFLAIAGGADVLSAVFRGTILQDETPDALRGRLNALNIMVVTGGPRLGDFEAGLVAGAFGVVASIVTGGLACVIGTGILSRAVPAFRRYEAPVVIEETDE
jgi:MFS family permease